MANLKMHFHGNFALKKEEIRRILQTATEEKGLNDTLENLMQRTSLGNAKVGQIKSWAIRAGLIQDNRPTPEGKIVLRLDSFLQTNITDWLMHFYLSFGERNMKQLPKNPADWGGWCYFVHSFLPQHRQFTMNELIENSTTVFEETKKIITERLKYILRAYTETQALASCRFIELNKNDTYQTGNANLPNVYMIGYFLAQLWERDFKTQTSVLTKAVVDQPMGLTTILGISTDDLQEHFNNLEAYGLIEQRRTVPPFQIVRRWDNSLTLLEKAYANQP